jgi:hypothetical protein
MPPWAKTLGMSMAVLCALWLLYDLTQAARDVGTIVANNDNSEPRQAAAPPGASGAPQASTPNTPATPRKAPIEISDDALIRQSPAKEWNTLTPRFKRALCSDYGTFTDGFLVRQFWLSTNADDLGDVLDFVNQKC